jgi:hypothetical protein
MTEYLKACRDKLVPGGYVIFDMVDRSFDSMSNNQYMTDDWQLSEAKRRPSQYVVRISPNDLRDAAAKAGFTLRSQLRGTKVPPRYVAVLEIGR